MDRPFWGYEPTFFNYTHVKSSNMLNAHYHDTYEIYYLLSGCRRYLVKNDLFDVYPGEFVLIPSLTIHRTMNVPNEHENSYHSRYLLSPSKDQIPDVFLPLFNTYHYQISESEQASVMACFADISANTKTQDIYSSYVNQANLIKLLSIIARCPTSTAQTSIHSGADLQMYQAATFIKEHCDKPLALETVAKEFGFSKEYFSSLFKSSTGFGFNDYLNQMRISKASTLLLTTNLSIARISEQCGFNDSNYFAAVFKKNLGIPPSQFRLQKSSHSI